MIDALIKHVSVTYNCYEMCAIGEKRCNCSSFEIDQEMDAILLTIGINYEGAKIFGVFRVKNHDVTPINLIFFQF